MKYVIKTNKGFISGDLHQGVKFHKTRFKAREFDASEVHCYWKSVCADMFQFFGCEWCKVRRAFIF